MFKLIFLTAALNGQPVLFNCSKIVWAKHHPETRLRPEGTQIGYKAGSLIVKESLEEIQKRCDYNAI